MIADVEALLDRYRRWLADETSLRSVGDLVEITTPYLDRHNDCLQIYARRHEGDFVLTDGGYTIEDLAMSGFSLDSPKRRTLLQTTLNGFGVRLEENTNALEIRTSAEDFAPGKHNLVQAMLAVNDLFQLTSPSVVNPFHLDVADWLKDAAIRYTPDVTFTGKSGYGHRFHFVIPSSATRPERVLKVINQPGRNAAQAMVFAWMDARAERPPNSRAYAILNDAANGPVPSGVLDALRSYEVEPVRWSGRDRAKEELTA